MTQAKTLKRRLYNVSAVANYVLEERHPLYLRAIKLYETQIAIYFGEKLTPRQSTRKQFPARWLAISSDILAAARVCSSIRLLQHIQKTRHLSETSLFNLLDEPEAREVLGRVLEEPVGLRKLAIALRPRTVDHKLKRRRNRQRRYAPLYDVSLRWPLGPGSKMEGGWTTATALFKPKQGSFEHEIVRRHYPGLRGRSKAYEFADEGDFLAGFVWLAHFGDEHFQPRQVEKASFARKLLADAQDVSKLARIFGRYEFIKARLEERRYKLLALDLAVPVPAIASVISPLPEELLEAISSTES